VRELYALHSQIFDGVSLTEFRRQVFDGAGAPRTRIVIGRVGGEAVAYSAVHVFGAELDGARVPIVRAEAGALPDYRGRLFMARLWARELLRARVVYRCAPWYVGTFVHPSAYVALTRLCDVLPRPGHLLPSELLEQIERACELRTEGLGAGLARVGWVVRECDAQRYYWQARADTATRYFITHNMRRDEGVGLTVAVRFDLRTLAAAIWRAVQRRW